MKIVEFDTIFISYDEPNAEINFANLSNIVPWTKRVHGVKGSDAAHKAAANISETEWFITIDADNIVYPDFFDLDLDMSDPKIQVYGWCGRNAINGLRYGNGGPKIWNRNFVFDMKTHESAENDRAQVDFCWEDGYKNFAKTYSDSVINTTPLQAWRAGFREGVKMTLLDGVRISAHEITQRIWWHNIHRLKIWSTIGAHAENGLYAILGARQGTFMTNCSDWDYTNVRDFDYLNELFASANLTEKTDNQLIDEINSLGESIKNNIGLNLPFFDELQSEYMCEMYNETIELCRTYKG